MIYVVSPNKNTKQNVNILVFTRALTRFCFVVFCESEFAGRCFVESTAKGKSQWTTVPTLHHFAIIWDDSESESSEFDFFDVSSENKSKAPHQVAFPGLRRIALLTNVFDQNMRSLPDPILIHVPVLSYIESP